MLNHIEETKIKLKLANQEKNDYLFRLQLLMCFRPDASLRQINNQAKATFGHGGRKMLNLIFYSYLILSTPNAYETAQIQSQVTYQQCIKACTIEDFDCIDTCYTNQTK